MTPQRVLLLASTSIAALLGLSALLGSFYTIDQGERGVVLTNGRVSDVVDAGLHWKVPFVQSVLPISTRTVTRTYEKVASYTSDRQTAEVSISITYALDPAKVADAYAQYNERGDTTATAITILDPKLFEQFKNIFGQFNAVAVVQKRTELNNDIQIAMQKATLGTGLIVKSVQIQNVDFSDAYEHAIEESAEAQAKVQTATNKLEEVKMQAQQQVVQAEAGAKALRASADAEAYQTTVKGNADATAIRVKAEALKGNTELVALTLAQTWDGALPSTMVPGQGVPLISIK